MTDTTDETSPAGGDDKRRFRLTLGVVAALAAALVFGAGLAFGARSVLETTNRIDFCTSCHEMADNNFAEYRNTVHARSRSGVQATCSDCHVPHEFPDVLVRKITAARDVVSHLMGTIDTPEKFQAHKLELAKRVWVRMKETDSRECRNCHNAQAMDLAQQGKVARRSHESMLRGEATCIDCHYGIAHKEPPGGLEPQDAINDARGATH